MSSFLCRRIFQFLGSRAPKHTIRVTFANGSIYKNFEQDVKPEVEVIFRTRRAQWRSILLGYTGLAEAYINGQIDLLGSHPIHSLTLMAGESGLGNKVSLPNPIYLMRQLRWEHKVSNKSFLQARKNAIAHYNLPGEFFRIVLGDTYGYCEGYYQNGYDGDGTRAQHDRFDLTCRKLLLKPGDKLIEVGSGWGYMSVLAAEKYGAEVTNYGIVPEQNKVMQRMIDQKNLQSKVRIVEKDHRELLNEPAKYDKYVSLGVYEHAGRYQIEDWIKSVSTCLKPGGVGVLSAMFEMSDVYTSFLTTRYVFPGGDLPSLPITLELMAKYDLTVIDMENLWYHYRQAVLFWAKNFRENWDKIHALDPKLFDERFRRIWTLYLESVGEAFAEEWLRLNVFHITFTKGRRPEYYPATRDFLYVSQGDNLSAKTDVRGS